MIEIGILRFFSHFSKIWRNSERYKADKIGERAKPCPMPTFTLNIDEEKLFHE